MARPIRVRRGNFGDHASVGDGVNELRVHFGPGYRAYYTGRDRVIVFMLLAGSKRTRTSEISRAKAIARNIED